MKSLARVERALVIYTTETNKDIREINLDDVPFEQIASIVVLYDNDPLLCAITMLVNDGYERTEEQVSKFTLIVQTPIVPNFNLYFLCTGMHRIF